MEWTDVSSYSKGERGKIEPKSVQLKFGDRRMVVCKHRDYDGEFIIRGFGGFSFDYTNTYTKDLEKAKEIAVEFLRKDIRKQILELQEIESIIAK